MKQKELLVLSIVIFLTIIAWVVFEIHQVSTKSALEESLEAPPVGKEKINGDVFMILQNKKK